MSGQRRTLRGAAEPCGREHARESVGSVVGLGPRESAVTRDGVLGRGAVASDRPENVDDRDRTGLHGRRWSDVVSEHDLGDATRLRCVLDLEGELDGRLNSAGDVIDAQQAGAESEP